MEGLAISRRKEQSIIIGDSIRIKVIDIGSHKVRLLIDAPRDMPVHREEIYNAIQQEWRKGES